MSEIKSDLSFQKLKSNLGMCEQNEKHSSDMLNYAIESCTSLCLESRLLVGSSLWKLVLHP